MNSIEEPRVSDEILKTKLFIPRLRSDLIPRSRLVVEINKGIQRKIILLTAPAGFGKSTLLAEWAHQASLPVCWLSLDKSENNPQVLFSYFIASMQTRFPGFGASIKAALDSPLSPPLHSLINMMINEITQLHQHFAFVLDDFHLIDAQPAIQALGYLIDHQPPQLHLVIASRSELPLSLSRLRIQGELILLGIHDLRFNSAEVRKLFHNSLGERISDEEVTILEQRTEGWIAGLQMAMLSLQAREDIHAYITSFSGADRLVSDYLLDEVFSYQDQQIKDFLLQTSILEKLSTPLCNQVTETQGSQVLLEHLERMGLFIIPIDNTRTWYRYHHLFAEYLQSRLAEEHPGKEIILHKRASDWYQEHGMPEEAVEHIFKTGDYALIVQRIEQVSHSALASGRFKTFMGWMEKMPKQYAENNPYLLLLRAFMLFELSDLQGYHRCITRAQKLIGSPPSDPELKEATKTWLYGIYETIRGLYSIGGEGDFESGYSHAQTALRYLPEDPPFWRVLAWMVSGLYNQWLGDFDLSIEFFEKATEINLRENYFFLGVISISVLGKLYLRTGYLTKALEICQKGIELDVRQEHRIGLSGPVYLLMGELCLLRGELNDAEQYTAQGIDLVGKHRDVNSLINGYFNLARIQLLRGKKELAEDIMEKMTLLISDFSPSRNSWKKAHACRAYVWIYSGNLKYARQWRQNLDRNQLDQDFPFDVLSDYAYRGIYLAPQDLVCETVNFIQLTEARLKYAEGEYKEALETLEQFISKPNMQKRIYCRIQFLSVKALVLEALGRMEEAAGRLLEAIHHAAPQNLIYPFILEGEALVPILNRVAQILFQGARFSTDELFYTRFIEKLLHRIEDSNWYRKKAAEYELTPREIEVLIWLSKGLSYREVSEHLAVSENTLRTHIKRVYQKLGVNNRVQALNMAKSLGVLD